MSFKSLADSIVGTCNKVFGDGDTITYTPSGGSPIAINAVFDNTWVDIQGTMSLKPTLVIQLSALVSAPAKGDQVTINSVVYRVVESRPDAFGGSTLILQK